MYECHVGMKVIWHHWSTTTITTISNHSRHWQKWHPSAAHKALHPAPSSSIDGRQPPEQVDIICKGLRECMALKTLRCYSNASLPEQRSTLRAIPPQHPQYYIRLLGGSSPINMMRRHEAQCLVWGVRGAFLLLAAMVVMVFCSVPEHKPFFRLNHGIVVGIARKLMSRATGFLHCTEAEM